MAIPKKEFSLSHAFTYTFTTFTHNIAFFLKIIGLTFIAALCIYLASIAILYFFFLSASIFTQVLLLISKSATSSNHAQELLNPHIFFILHYIALSISSLLAYYYLLAVVIKHVLPEHYEITISSIKQLLDKQFFKFFIARIFYSILIAFGSLFFIIPGIYLYLKYYFTGYGILNKHTTQDESLTVLEDHRYAGRISSGNLIKLLLFTSVWLILYVIISSVSSLFFSQTYINLFASIIQSILFLLQTIGSVYIFKKLQ